MSILSFCRVRFYYNSFKYVQSNIQSQIRHLFSYPESEQILTRQELKAIGMKNDFINNISSLRVVGNKSQGYPPSLLLKAHSEQYLFNCGGGFQRITTNNEVRKTRKINNVFVTSLQWQHLEGIPGKCISETPTTIHGPPGIKKLLNICKAYVYKLNSQEIEYHERSKYSDSFIDMDIVPLVAHHTKTSDTKRRKNSSALSLAYVCKLADISGAIDPQKCKELKVPIGPLLGKLKSGQNIVLEDGREIKSKDVCGPAKVGEKFMVIECLSEEQVGALQVNEFLNQFRSKKLENGNKLQLVVHFSSKKILSRPLYQEWIDGFDSSCKHVVIDSSENLSSLIGTYRQQYMLNKLDSKIFPKLFKQDDIGNQVENLSPQDLAKDEEFFIETLDEKEMNQRILALQSMDLYCFSTKQVLRRKPAKKLSQVFEAAIANTTCSNDLKALHKLQEQLPEPKSYEPEVVFLGTGSSYANKYRNVSGILVNFTHPQHASVILDCGENTYGQLLRHFGKIKTRKILSQLKLIYVSHFHLDHHLGLVELLRQRNKETNEAVILLIPPDVSNLIDFHSEFIGNLSHTYRSFSTMDLVGHSDDGFALAEQKKAEIYKKTDDLVQAIEILRVKHCRHSCSVVFTFRINHKDMESFTLAYSGDTRPSVLFATLGNGCDLLIHESTFEHFDEDDAIYKFHCTTHEAISISEQMKAKFTILTHFSAKTPKVPVFTDRFDKHIGVAFDNLRVKCPTHLQRLGMMNGVFSSFFKESVDGAEDRIAKKRLNREIRKQLLKTK